MNKKTILVDLDGVLNEYKGDYNDSVISSVRAGAKEFLEELSNSFIVKIFTTRSVKKVEEWFSLNKLNSYISGVTNKKEPAYLIIDDRCINFDGDYKSALEKIKNFKVWYK